MSVGVFLGRCLCGTILLFIALFVLGLFTIWAGSGIFILVYGIVGEDCHYEFAEHELNSKSAENSYYDFPISTANWTSCPCFNLTNFPDIGTCTDSLMYTFNQTFDYISVYPTKGDCTFEVQGENYTKYDLGPCGSLKVIKKGFFGKFNAEEYAYIAGGIFSAPFVLLFFCCLFLFAGGFCAAGAVKVIPIPVRIVE